jgi:hypothetical protein
LLVLSHSMDADPASHLAIRCAKKFRQPRCLDLRLHFNRVDRVVKKPLPTAIILEAKSTNNHKWCTSQCRHLMPDGSRCGTMSMVEIDHIVPVARGGEVRRLMSHFSAGSIINIGHVWSWGTGPWTSIGQALATAVAIHHFSSLGCEGQSK